MPRKAATKKKEEVKKPPKEIKSDHHWTKLRSKEKDTSKRILPDTILPGTRKRTNYNYNLNAMAKNNIDNEKVVKNKPSVSVNSLEQREKLKALEAKKKKKAAEKESEQRRRRKVTKKEEDEESKKKKKTDNKKKEEEEEEKDEVEEEETTTTTQKKVAASKKRGRQQKKKQEEEDEDEEDTEKDAEEEDEEPKAKKQATSKKQETNNNKKNNKKKDESEEEEANGEPLSQKVIDLAVKLGAKPSSTNGPRKYAGKYDEPLAIRTFNNFKWPKVCFASEKHNFGGMELAEIDLAERNEYKFLKDRKTIIIGSGDVIMAAKLDDLSSDFNVWIIDDENKDASEGPFKISEILKELTVDEDADAGEE